jgi:hypothetical protein
VERVRELGGVEFLLDTMERQQAAGHLVRIVEFEGPVDPQLLERAFRQLVARRPLFRTRIDRSGGGRPVFVLDDGVRPEFSIVDRQSADHWIREFDEQLNTRISVDDDAPVRALLLASEEDGGEIIVSAAHSACDGRSLFAFCRDLINNYDALRRGDEAPMAPGGFSPPLEALLPEWLTADRLEAMIDDFVTQAAATAGAPIVLFPYGSADLGTAGTSHVMSCSLPAPETAELKRRARANGTSVTGAIAAAEIQAIAELSRAAPDCAIVSAVTVDVRPHLREPVPLENLGAYLGSIFTRHADVGAMAPWALAREVTTQLAAKVDRCDHLVMTVLGERFVDQFVSVDRPVGSVSLANLGLQELSGGTSVLRPRCVRGGAPLHMTRFPGPYCQAVTTSGVLWLTFSYVAPHMPHDLVRDFAESVVERLRFLAGPVA